MIRVDSSRTALGPNLLSDRYLSSNSSRSAVGTCGSTVGISRTATAAAATLAVPAANDAATTWLRGSEQSCPTAPTRRAMTGSTPRVYRATHAGAPVAVEFATVPRPRASAVANAATFAARPAIRSISPTTWARPASSS